MFHFLSICGIINAMIACLENQIGWLSQFSALFVLFLGIQAAICPCLLTMTIAAIAYLGRSQNVWYAGLLFALGQILSFWGLTVLILGISLVSGDYVTRFLASTLHASLGPLLILIGMMLAGLIRFSHVSWDGKTMEKIIHRCGVWSALPLGMLFAMAFCPTTAAVFLAMLALTAKRMADSGSIVPLFFFPALFGVGTSLPILMFSLLLATQRRLLNRTFQKITGFERPARWFTGSIFIVAGLWLTFCQIF